MKLHVWTDEVSFLAVAHAESVAEARKLLEGEIGGFDGSCPERAKARELVMAETSAIYTGRTCAFCLSDSAEVREQVGYSRKLEARIAALEAELAEARKDSAQLRDMLQGAEAALDTIRTRCLPLGTDSGDSGTVIIAEAGLATIRRMKGKMYTESDGMENG